MTTKINGIDSENAGGGNEPPMTAGKKTGKKRSILAYFLLPGIIPEIKELTRNKFGYLAYLIAIIYQIVRILPSNHPYTKPINIGKFNIRQVIATAADHITLDRHHIDQIIVFVAILAGLILLVLQFVSFIFFLFMGNAWAGAGIPAESASLFTTAKPQTDLAFYMIREVFGLPDMFGKLDNQTALHLALHKLFEFYNLAILFVAVLIFLYYVVVVVGETAQTGVPFGQRFSHIYAPFRLVIAIGLLVPLNYGFNGAQYMAFYAAKLGSSLATNGWIRFNTALEGSNPLGAKNSTLIAQPNNPDLSGLVEAMSVFVTCREAYEIQRKGGTTSTDPTNRLIKAYVVDSNNKPLIVSAAGDWTAIEKEFIASHKKGHISVYFGEVNTNDKQHPGNSTPWCGEIKFPLQLDDQKSVHAVGEASPKKIQENYFLMTMFLWLEFEDLTKLGQRIARAHDLDTKACAITIPNGGKCETSYKPPASFRKEIILTVNLMSESLTDAVFTALRNQVDYTVDKEIMETGWGGAGIWYNKIAQVNGAFVTATMNIPNIEKRPMAMENTSKEKQKADSGWIDCKGYEPNLAENKAVKLGGQTNDYYAAVLNETYQYWRCDRSGAADNVFLDTISAVFGLNGLFNIRDNKGVDGNGNVIREHIHPLAKLSTVGKSLVESAIQNMGMAMGMSFGGGILGVLNPAMGQGLEAFSSMFVSIATIGLSVGFLLFYILPFMPFMYFFFAVGGWVKGLFEAMVGVPLWALAHLRIDGDGLPGKSAMNGYFLIFEIFLRPILTVFGLLGGLAIFTAMATILDDIFDLAVVNVTGSDASAGEIDSVDNTIGNLRRNFVDKFFFTVVYAIILYMMAISSFKMITMVPNNILRWIGQSVATFNDSAEDPGAGLAQYTTIGTQQIGSKLMGGMTQLSKGAGSLGGEAIGIVAGKGNT